MMLGLDFDAQILKGQEHLGAQVLKFIHGRNRKIAFFVARLVAQVGTFVPAGVPVAFDGIDFIKSRVAGGFKTNIIKDKKFGLRAKVSDITDAAAF